MKLNDTTIAWTPNRSPNLKNASRGKIVVVDRLNEHRLHGAFVMKVGYVFYNWNEWSHSKQAQYFHNCFKEMLNKDNMVLSDVLKALSAIDDLDTTGWVASL